MSFGIKQTRNWFAGGIFCGGDHDPSLCVGVNRPFRLRQGSVDDEGDVVDGAGEGEGGDQDKADEHYEAETLHPETVIFGSAGSDDGSGKSDENPNNQWVNDDFGDVGARVARCQVLSHQRVPLGKIGVVNDQTLTQMG